MKNLFLFCLVFLLGAGIFFTISTHQTAGKNEKLKKSERPIENRYIVVLNDEDEKEKFASASETEFASRELAGLYGGKIDKQFTSAVKGYSVEMSVKEAEFLSRDPRVKYVEEDGEIEISNVQTGATSALKKSYSSTKTNPVRSNKKGKSKSRSSSLLFPYCPNRYSIFSISRPNWHYIQK